MCFLLLETRHTKENFHETLRLNLGLEEQADTDAFILWMNTGEDLLFSKTRGHCFKFTGKTLKRPEQQLRYSHKLKKQLLCTLQVSTYCTFHVSNDLTLRPPLPPKGKCIINQSMGTYTRRTLLQRPSEDTFGLTSPGFEPGGASLSADWSLGCCQATWKTSAPLKCVDCKHIISKLRTQSLPPSKSQLEPIQPLLICWMKTSSDHRVFHE